jgi:hypothetical protein
MLTVNTRLVSVGTWVAEPKRRERMGSVLRMMFHMRVRIMSIPCCRRAGATCFAVALGKEGHGDGAQSHTICFARRKACMIVLTNRGNVSRRLVRRSIRSGAIQLRHRGDG